MEHNKYARTNGCLPNGHGNTGKVTLNKVMSSDLNDCDTGAIFVMEDEDHQTVLLNSLNMMRKSRTFCDVILNPRSKFLPGKINISSSLLFENGSYCQRIGSFYAETFKR